MKQKIITLIIFIAAMFFLGVACNIKEGPEIPTVKKGMTVPDGFNLPVTGISFIAFFNPECPDCTKELPVIQELYDKYVGAVNFMAIGRDMTRNEIKAYFGENDLYMTFQEDPDRKIYNAFGLSHIPACFLCKDGVIKNTWSDNPIMTTDDFEKAYGKIK